MTRSTTRRLILSFPTLLVWFVIGFGCIQCAKQKPAEIVGVSESEKNDVVVEPSDSSEFEASSPHNVRETLTEEKQLPVHLRLGFSSTFGWVPGGHVHVWGPKIPELHQLSNINDILTYLDQGCVLHTDATTTCWCTKEGNGCKEGIHGLNGQTGVIGLLRPYGKDVIWAMKASGELISGAGVSTGRIVPNSLEVAVAGETVCVLTKSLKVLCWDLERETTEVSASPDLPSQVLSLTSGQKHFCALMDDRTVYCWGHADGGIGVGASVEGSFEPKAVVDVSDVAQLEGASSYSCARLRGGRVKCWGFVPQPHWKDPEIEEHDDSAGFLPFELPNIENAIDIALGTNHMCVTLADERVFCWGEDEDSQLGTSPPLPALFSREPLVIGGLEDVVDLSLGDKSACALKSDQSIWCWGENDLGQLGFESVWKEWGTPQRAQVPPGAVKLVMNNDTGCALSDSGKLVCWGARMDLPVTTGFRLEWHDPGSWSGGADETEETMVNVTDLSMDVGTSCFIAGGGRVGCCDFFVGGGCRIIEGVKGATQVRASRIGCALTESGEVYCWGDVTYSRPVSPGQRVRKLKRATELFKGPNGFCARHKNRTVSCWETSFGEDEQLVLGKPTPMTGAEDMAQIAQFRDYGCAVHKDGTVSCWGMLVDDIESETPTIIEGLEGVAQVEIGGTFACARLEDGTVKCWGEGYSGQLGISRRYRPVELNWKEKLLPQ